MTISRREAGLSFLSARQEGLAYSLIGHIFVLFVKPCGRRAVWLVFFVGFHYLRCQNQLTKTANV